MSTVICPTPALCKARSHTLNSSAERWCSSRRRAGGQPQVVFAPLPERPSRSSAPISRRQMMNAELAGEPVIEPVDSYRGTRQNDVSDPDGLARRREMIASAYAATDPDGWHSDCGRPHPTGGYTLRYCHFAADNKSVEVSHYGEDGSPHRADGPDRVRYTLKGPVEAAWHIAGAPHRTDGPVHIQFSGPSAAKFKVDGKMLVASTDTYQRFSDLVASGASRDQAMAWIPASDALGVEGAADLIAEGADAQETQSLIDAGVDDLEALRRVARKELPASWAVAGL